MTEDNPITGTVDDDTTTYTVWAIPDEPATVLIQEHDSGRLRSVHWLDPAAAAELGRLLVSIAKPLTRETIDS